MAFRIDWSVAGYRFNKYQPVVIDGVDNKVGHLSVDVDGYAQLLKRLVVKHGKLVLCITHIQEICAGCPPRAEFVDDPIYKNIVVSWGEGEGGTIGEYHRNELLLTFPSPSFS